MGRPPSNGGPAFRFILSEVTEMEAILLQHNTAMPGRHILEALADKFSESPERKGKILVQFKQRLLTTIRAVRLNGLDNLACNKILRSVVSQLKSNRMIFYRKG